MENYQNQYSAPPQSDEFGNPIHHGDAAAWGGHGTGGAHTTGIAGHTGDQTKLHRSGSSSSSSSEDDGQGGRRKKGIKEKIKEKLPGVHKDQPQAGATTTPAGGHHTGEYGTGPEKKGIMDKIKEKLPGHHGEQRHSA